MPVTLDHLVVAGTDLSALVAWWAAQSGVHPAVGGSHVGLGTKNALVGLGSSYLELIGPDPAQEAPAGPRPFGIDDLPESSIQFVTYALAVDDLDAAVAELASNDVQLSPPLPMSRERPDGSILTWRLSLPSDFDGVMPFLIEWGPAAEHPSSSLAPGCSVSSIQAFHPEAELLAAALAAIEAPYPVETADRPGLSATLATPNGEVLL